MISAVKIAVVRGIIAEILANQLMNSYYKMIIVREVLLDFLVKINDQIIY